MFYYVESLVKPGEVTISLSWMTFWWCSFLRILISRIAVMGNYARYRNDEEYINQTKKKRERDTKSPETGARILTPSRSLSMRIFLSATISCVSVSLAMYTCLRTTQPDWNGVFQGIGNRIEIGGRIDRFGAYPYVPSPICSSFSKQSTLREPHEGDSSRLSWPGAATAMAAGTERG